MHSPKIERIEVTAIGDVNRAKLYYLRGKVGKRARVRVKRGAVLPVMEPAPTESDMPPEDEEPEALDEVAPEEPEQVEAQVEETAEEPGPEPESAVEPEPEPVPE
jgi:large subunit ribosomal protein L19